MTGNPVCFATRSAVRCRVPDSVVSMRRVGEQLDGRAQDAGGVAVEHDGAVHLRELAQAGGGELDVEREAAGADRLDGPVVAEDDERAGASAQDALEAVAQLGARGDGGERGAQELVVGEVRGHA